jgi:transcriptional regulator with XRE-family HTH domain
MEYSRIRIIMADLIRVNEYIVILEIVGCLEYPCDVVFCLLVTKNETRDSKMINSVEQLLVHTGQRLKAARKQKGFTQGELAERLGMSQNTISRYETGNLCMTLPKLYEIAETLDVSMSYFFEMFSDETVADDYDALEGDLRDMARKVIKRLLEEQEKLARDPRMHEAKQIILTVYMEPHKVGAIKNKHIRLAYEEAGGKWNDLNWSVRTIIEQQALPNDEPDDFGFP